MQDTTQLPRVDRPTQNAAREENTMMTRHLASLLALTLLTACEPRDPASETDDDAGGSPGASGAFFLPTGEPDNTGAPVVEVDAAGGTHAVYPAYAGGDAYYAYCAKDCRGTDDVRVVRFPTDGTVSAAMLALDDSGRPQAVLSAYAGVYYAACTGDCATEAGWTVTRILEHGGDRQVTGQALALDAQGRPRFLMHTTVAYLGIGQKPPATFFVQCDAGCAQPESWSTAQIADQIWRSTSLHIDGAGRFHAGTVAMVVNEQNSTEQVAAYVTCEAGCQSPDAWVGQGLVTAHEAPLEAVAIEPAISLALTKSGAPRMALMGEDEFHQRNISYWSCDGDCANATWDALILSHGNDHGAGLDLALDGSDRPRIAHTFQYNILVARCDAESCTTAAAPWAIDRVEAGAEMPPDTLYLYPNCVVSAWFLHSPSIALTTEGAPRVGYQARDISGGWKNPTPDETPDCVAGTDMTWSRLALMQAGK